MVERLRLNHCKRRIRIRELNISVLLYKSVSVHADDRGRRNVVIVELPRTMPQHLLGAGVATAGKERGQRQRTCFRKERQNYSLKPDRTITYSCNAQTATPASV